jgi:hypothetical protein
MDLDPVTVDFWHCDFLPARSVLTQRYSSAIHSPVGTAQRRSGKPGSPSAWERSCRRSRDNVCCRSAQRTAQELFLFDQFQFALPPDWNAIILLRKVGIGPVGA